MLLVGFALIVARHGKQILGADCCNSKAWLRVRLETREAKTDTQTVNMGTVLTEAVDQDRNIKQLGLFNEKHNSFRACIWTQAFRICAECTRACCLPHGMI